MGRRSTRRRDPTGGAHDRLVGRCVEAIADNARISEASEEPSSDPTGATFSVAARSDLVAAGLIEDYALGGALAAIYYVEPFTTYDADIIFVAAEKGLTRQPVCSHLRLAGVWTASISLSRFSGSIPCRGRTTEEAFAEAREIEYEGCPRRSCVPSISSRLLPASDDTRIWRESSNYSNEPRSTERSWTTSLRRYKLQLPKS